jgi:bis(5'-nucleosyl)-tetraphosphatase (symmetrical)
MPSYAIGDIQGCHAEFVELLGKLRFDPARDRLWLVGDLVNRGPQSLQVLRYVRELGDAATVVLGNHDLHLLAVAFGHRDRLREDDTLEDILAAPDCDALLDWLRRQPLLHHDGDLGYTMIHAGLPPQWDLRTAQECAREVERTLRDDRALRSLLEQMYGNRPNRWSPDLTGTDRLRFIVNCFTRLRVCDADGALDLKYKGTLAKIPAGLLPWFRVPAAPIGDAAGTVRPLVGARLLRRRWCAGVGYRLRLGRTAVRGAFGFSGNAGVRGFSSTAACRRLALPVGSSASVDRHPQFHPMLNGFLRPQPF